MAAPSVPGADRVGVSEFLARRAAEALGLCLLAVALVVAVALWGYDPNDPSLNHAIAGPSTNPLGGFGASVADIAAADPRARRLADGADPAALGAAPDLRPGRSPGPGCRSSPCRSRCSPARPGSRPGRCPTAGRSGSASAASSATSCCNRLERPFGPELYPTVTGSIALVLRDPGGRPEPARDLAGARARWRWRRGAVGRPPAGEVRAGEPRWAQAIEQRYGAPPAPQRPPPAARRRPRPDRRAARRPGPTRRAASAPRPARGDIKRTIDPAIAATESRGAGGRSRRRPRRGRRRRPRRRSDADRAPGARQRPPSRRSWSPEAGFKLPPLELPRAPAPARRRQPGSRERSPRPPARSRRCWTISACAARSSTCGPGRWSRSTSSSRRPARARRGWSRSPTTSPARSARCRCASPRCRAAT